MQKLQQEGGRVSVLSLSSHSFSYFDLLWIYIQPKFSLPATEW